MQTEKEIEELKKKKIFFEEEVSHYWDLVAIVTIVFHCKCRVVLLTVSFPGAEEEATVWSVGVQYSTVTVWALSGPCTEHGCGLVT